MWHFASAGPDESHSLLVAFAVAAAAAADVVAAADVADAIAAVAVHIRKNAKLGEFKKENNNNTQ